MTLTSAPEIETLDTLTHDWRHVATMEGPGEWRWHGDLWKPDVFRIYKFMRDSHETVLQASYRPITGMVRVFAAIGKGSDPEAAYKAAVECLGGAAARSAQVRAMKFAAALKRRKLIVA